MDDDIKEMLKMFSVLGEKVKNLENDIANNVDSLKGHGNRLGELEKQVTTMLDHEMRIRKLENDAVVISVVKWTVAAVAGSAITVTVVALLERVL